MICECVVIVRDTDVLEDIKCRVERLMIEKKLYLNHNLTLQMLADEVGTNRTYLSRMFSQKMGMGFNHYLNNTRLFYAGSIVGDCSDMTDLAIRCGFGCVRTFYRTLAQVDRDNLYLLKKRYLCPN
ncbi:MAG: helix-turn-helix domain-containing protein, partial [Bacteroidia bacterium]|nr:helix-turn-helix domain-containing protein [Bacteroidia bacterium]